MASPITWRSIDAPSFSSSASSYSSGQRNFNDSLANFGKASTNLNDTLTGIDAKERADNTGKLAASLLGKSDEEVQAIMQGISADANIDNNAIFEIANKQKMDNSTLARNAASTDGQLIQNQTNQLTLDATPEQLRQQQIIDRNAAEQSTFKTGNQQQEFDLNQKATIAQIRSSDASAYLSSLNGQQVKRSMAETDSVNFINTAINENLDKFTDVDERGNSLTNTGKLNAFLSSIDGPDGKPLSPSAIKIATEYYSANNGTNANNAAAAVTNERAFKVNTAKTLADAKVKETKDKNALDNFANLVTSNKNGWGDTNEGYNQTQSLSQMRAAYAAGVPENVVTKAALDNDFNQRAMDIIYSEWLKANDTNGNGETTFSNDRGNINANSLLSGVRD